MLKLGKTRTASDQTLPSRRFHVLHRGIRAEHKEKTPRAKSTLGDDSLECANQDCGQQGEILIDGPEAIARFRLGYVLYRQHGTSLKPIFLMTQDGDTELYSHINCAVDAGLRPEELRKEECYHCGLQFFCEEEPEETALLIEIGEFKEGCFVAAHRGAIHWACAHRNWAPELFEELEGTTTTIKEAENAE